MTPAGAGLATDHLAQVRAATVGAITARPEALAAWECGSRSFDRSDAGSDLDVCVVVEEPGDAIAVLDAIEAALRGLPGSSDLAVWDVGEHGWMGLIQRFWQSRDLAAPGALPMVDVACVACSSEGSASDWRRWLEPERHGRALPVHDTGGLLARELPAARLDLGAHRERIRADVALAAERRWLFTPFVAKELARGRLIDAHASHRNHVVTPLVLLSGVVHRPLRHDFGLRYLHDELPAEVVHRLVPIVAPPVDAAGLARAAGDGRAWIDEIVDAIDVDAIDLAGIAAAERTALGLPA